MFRQALTRVVSDLELEISGREFELLERHYGLLERWNQRINLTSIRDPDEAAERHFGESLFLHMHLPSVASIVDVGSGGGFPGGPLGVMRPNARVVLLEAVTKKAAFLKEATRGLPNVEAVAARLADWAGPCDAAVMRAVAPEQVLADLAKRVELVAFLGTQEPATGDFRWREPLPLPWGNERRLWIGFHVKPTNPPVPRETLT